jgi:NAD dependent epimerase/dehydratase family enzyme
MFVYAIENESISGIYNAVAPETVSNRNLNSQLAQHLYGNRFISMPVPALALQIILGEMSIEVLKSATVNSQKIQDAGFKFEYPSVRAAIEQLLPNKKL